MRYGELNSGVLKIYISSWMYNLSVYFERVLILTLVFCYINILLEREVYIIYWFVMWFAKRCLANSWF